MQATVVNPNQTSAVERQNEADHFPSRIEQQVSDLGQATFKKEAESSFTKILRRVVPYVGSVGATGTTVASIVAVVYSFKDDSCDCNTDGSCTLNFPLAPVIATLVVATTSNVLTIIKDIYEYNKEKEDKNEALEKEKARSQLEAKRHEELSHLLHQTLTSIQSYQANQDKEHFNECVNVIKQIPQEPSGHPTRDLWLSTLIQMSNNEEGLKSNFETIQEIGEDLLKDDLTNVDHFNEKETHHANINEGEGRSAVLRGQKEIALGDKLSKYQKKWNKIEEKVGFPIQFLEINGIRYDRNGAVYGKEEARKKIDSDESINL